MPPQADLSEAQINDLVAYLRSLADPPYKGKKLTDSKSFFDVLVVYNTV